MSDGGSDELPDGWLPDVFWRETRTGRYVEHLVTSRRPPRLLYHYTSGTGLLGILAENALWATSVRHLNDSTEFRAASKIAAQAIGTALGRLRPTAAVRRAQKRLSGYFEMFESFAYVASLSEVADDLSQWRAYTPHGLGYAVGIEATAANQIAKATGFTLLPCLYSAAQQQELMDVLAEDVIDYLGIVREFDAPGRHPVNTVYGRDFLAFAAQVVAPLVKDESFSPEREWRLIAVKIDERNNREFFRPGRSALLPTVRFRWAVEDSPIKEIIVGPTPTPEEAMASIERVRWQHCRRAEPRLSRVPFRQV